MSPIRVLLVLLAVSAFTAALLVLGSIDFSPAPPPAAQRPTPPPTAADLARLARKTHLVLPRLMELDGYRLAQALRTNGNNVQLRYGHARDGLAGKIERADNPIEVDVGTRDNEHTDLMGMLLGYYYNLPPGSGTTTHHRGPVDYAEMDAGRIIFRYHSAYIGVTAYPPDRRGSWSKMIRAILAAPTVG